MSACIRKQFLQLALKPNSLCLAVFTRGSRYDKSYLKNSKDYEDIMTPLSKDDERMFKPIKAALSDESTFADGNPEIRYYTNMLMREGLKEPARHIIRNTLEQIKRVQIEKYHKADPKVKEEIELDATKIFLQALENAKPELHAVKIWKAGVYYKVPVPCPERKQRFYVAKWMRESGLDRDKKTSRMYEKLATDLLAAYNHEGSMIAKKQELYRVCEINKMYASLAYQKG